MGARPPCDTDRSVRRAARGIAAEADQIAASCLVRSAAGIALHPVAFSPDQSCEKSLAPLASATARSGCMVVAARGNGGATLLIGPISRMIRLTMPRAGRPVK